MIDIPNRETERGRRDLDRRLVSGVAWTAAARWTTQGISWLALFFLAKLLSPADFGLVGMAGVFMLTISMISEFGIDSAIIVTPNLTPAKLRQMNTVAALLGVAGTLIGFVATIPIATFFREPKLKAIIPAMVLGFAMNGLKIVPQSALLKELRFKLVSRIEMVQGVLQAGVAVVLAYLGLRYWAIILGNLISSLVMTVLMIAFHPCGFSRPCLRTIKKELTFSRKILTMRVAWNVYSNFDFVAAGRCLGKTALGTYTMAWNIANVPLERVTSLVLRVTPTIFSKVQHDPAELRRYFGMFLEGIALITFPLSLGLALVAQPLMTSVFDARWQNAVMPLRILAMTVGLRSLTAVIPQVLNFVNDVDYAMWQTIATAAILCPSFFYASRWGSSGIAMVWLVVACPFTVATLLARACQKTGLSFGDFLRAIRPALLASTAMAVAVLAEYFLIGGHFRPWTKLIAESLSGAAVYAGLVLAFHGPRLTTLYQVMLRKTVSATTA